VPGLGSVVSQLPQIDSGIASIQPGAPPSSLSAQTTPRDTYITGLNDQLDRTNMMLNSNMIPDMGSYNTLAQRKQDLEKAIYLATDPDYPASVEEFEYAKNSGYPGTFQDWINAKKSGTRLITHPDGSVTYETGSAVGGPGATTPSPGALATDWAYVRDSDGNLVYGDDGLPIAAPIPGSKAALEIEKEEEASKKRNEAQTITDAEKSGAMLTGVDKIREIMAEAKTPTTGTASVLFSLYSGSAAGRLRSWLHPLKSGVALNAMVRLKNASATGSTGFGQMNEKELELLITDIGALDPDTTEPDIFLSTLDRIEGRYERVMTDITTNVSPERIRELGLEPLFDDYKEMQDKGVVGAGRTVTNGNNVPANMKTIRFGDPR
jgi:hypothetical protein